MYKKIISILLISSFIYNFWEISFARREDKDYEAHKTRVKEICKSGDLAKIVSIVKTRNDYTQASDMTWSTDVFSKRKKIYRDNMNDIYKCALLKAQIKWLKDLKEEIIPRIDITWDILKNNGQKFDTQIEKLEIKATTLCNNKETSKEDKTEILKNTTQETCIYVSYLEYLKKYYQTTASLVALENTWWVINDTLNKINWVSPISWLNQTYNNTLNDIQSEEDNTYNISPIAFQSYLEYETNYPIHQLLELLRETYIVFREKLNSVINPINQLVYKISNAMKQ